MKTPALSCALIALLAASCQTPQPNADSGAPAPPAGSTGQTGSTGRVADSPAVVESGVTIGIDRTSYRPGAQVQLRIASQSRDTLGFNPCNRSIERRSGSSWASVPEPDRICTMELWLLEPNATRSATTDLPASLAAGTYRLVILFNAQKPDARTTVRGASASFRVE